MLCNSRGIITIDYDDLKDKWDCILKYLMEQADRFTWITRQKRPYTATPPLCKHDDIISILNPFLFKQEVGITKWPGTERRGATHIVMNWYKACRGSYELLRKLGNPFFPIQNRLPEDIAFYKVDSVFFFTVSHEKYAFFQSAKEQDFNMLKENGINYWSV